MYKKMFRTLFYLLMFFQIMLCMFVSLMVVFQSPAVCRDLPLEIGQGRDRFNYIWWWTIYEILVVQYPSVWSFQASYPATANNWT